MRVSITAFDALPADARVWVFGCDPAPDARTREDIARDVDAFLESWAAHGEELRVGRQWLADRFLVIAVDEHSAGASGCSIDALYHRLGAIEQVYGVTLRAGGRVFYRGERGVQSIQRSEITARVRAGDLTADAVVYDTSVTKMDALRASFERPARESWMGPRVTQTSADVGENSIHR
jgi:hypothetical protein